MSTPPASQIPPWCQIKHSAISCDAWGLQLWCREQTLVLLSQPPKRVRKASLKPPRELSPSCCLCLNISAHPYSFQESMKLVLIIGKKYTAQVYKQVDNLVVEFSQNEVFTVRLDSPLVKMVWKLLDHSLSGGRLMNLRKLLTSSCQLCYYFVGGSCQIMLLLQSR